MVVSFPPLVNQAKDRGKSLPLSIRPFGIRFLQPDPGYLKMYLDSITAKKSLIL